MNVCECGCACSRTWGGVVRESLGMLSFTAPLVMFMATEKPVSCHVLSRRLTRATRVPDSLNGKGSLALLLQQIRPTHAPAPSRFCSEHSHPANLFWAFHRTCNTLPSIFFFQATFSDPQQGWEGSRNSRCSQCAGHSGRMDTPCCSSAKTSPCSAPGQC